MARAFVFSDDTILCRQMPDGWWPLQVQLPKSSLTSNHSTCQPAYQLGHVTLLESLAPSHWLTDGLLEGATGAAHDVTDNHHFTAQATSAITYDYAIAHHIALPIIAESSADTFVPYRQLITGYLLHYPLKSVKPYNYYAGRLIHSFVVAAQPQSCLPPSMSEPWFVQHANCGNILVSSLVSLLPSLAPIHGRERRKFC